LEKQEKSAATVQQYTHAVQLVEAFLDGAEATKEALIDWKNQLKAQYKVSSINAFIAAVNGFLKLMGWDDCTVQALKTQKETFCDESRKLTKEDYEKLVKAAEAKGNRRLSLLIQTIGSTGIRVTEVQFITVEAVRTGKAVIDNKGKTRTVFLPKNLCCALTQYIKDCGLESGPVFVTRTGKPLDRSNIWRDMKALCKSADVEPSKVFPHSLRHLFARTHYNLEKDLSRLADILGHSSVNTTRIYTRESGAVHAAQLERLGLFVT